MGFGVVGGISMADIVAYWQAWPLCDFPRWIELVRQMDGVYMQHANTQQQPAKP